MAAQDERFNGYDFASHAGYGTAKHRLALEQQGITSLHRRSFAPIAKLIAANKTATVQPITNKQIGNQAEAAAAAWLAGKGFTIIERNWRTKFCEIDIVASISGCIYFVEVKHRKQADQGGGIAAITPRKSRQMQFAAELYLKQPNYQGSDATLAVITTHGDPIVIEALLELR